MCLLDACLDFDYSLYTQTQWEINVVSTCVFMAIFLLSPVFGVCYSSLWFSMSIPITFAFIAAF